MYARLLLPGIRVHRNAERERIKTLSVHSFALVACRAAKGPRGRTQQADKRTMRPRARYVQKQLATSAVLCKCGEPLASRSLYAKARSGALKKKFYIIIDFGFMTTVFVIYILYITGAPSAGRRPRRMKTRTHVSLSLSVHKHTHTQY